jgi:hypothetical protein
MSKYPTKVKHKSNTSIGTNEQIIVCKNTKPAINSFLTAKSDIDDNDAIINHTTSASELSDEVLIKPITMVRSWKDISEYYQNPIDEPLVLIDSFAGVELMSKNKRRFSSKKKYKSNASININEQDMILNNVMPRISSLLTATVAAIDYIDGNSTIKHAAPTSKFATEISIKLSDENMKAIKELWNDTTKTGPHINTVEIFSDGKVNIDYTDHTKE